jgi:hypothetical protein
MTLSTSVGINMTKSAVYSGELISLRKVTVTLRPMSGLMSSRVDSSVLTVTWVAGSVSSLKI